MICTCNEIKSVHILMMNSVEKSLQRAIQQILTPLVRILLRHGVAYADFAHWVKRIYVEVAEKEFVLEGRKQTDSRLSVLTGIHRKDVKVLRTEPLIESDDDFRRNRTARIVQSWQQDENFINSNGKPRLLTWKEEDSEFVQLVKKYGGDIPVRAVLEELIRTGIIVKTKDDLVELKRKSYLPLESEADMLSLFGDSTTELLETIDYNLQKPELTKFQLRVVYDNIPREGVEIFRNLSDEKSHELLVYLDRFLATQDRESNPNVEGSGRYRAGVGIYYFEDELESEFDENIKSED